MTTMSKEAATAFFADYFGGEHHIPGEIKPFGPGWYVSLLGELATFDFCHLTCLTFLAHDRCVRVSVMSGGPNRLRIAIHQRKREGRIFDRHPTLDQAIADWRKARAIRDDHVH